MKALVEALEKKEDYYIFEFSNKGGLIMPIPLELTYEDGTKDLIRIPVEIWRKNLNIADKKTLFQLANDIGIDSKIKHVFNEEKVENILKKYTEDAEVDNVFGVPTFIYRKKLFWGQDRLFFLEKELF